MSDRGAVGDKASSYTPEYGDVIAAERKRIQRDPVLGLAISGGGIRSASFGLGVMQGLVGAGLLKQTDYLSTVSGGGYIGSSLTWFLKDGFPDGAEAGTEEKDFPFGKARVGSRTEQTRNRILDYIRQHGNYLAPGFGLSMMSLVGVALRSVFASLFVYLCIATLALVILRETVAWIHSRVNGVFEIGSRVPSTLGLLIWVGGAVVVLLALAALGFSLGTRLVGGWGKWRYRWLIWGQRITGWLWTSVIVLLVVGSLPFARAGLGGILEQGLAGAGATVLGAIAGLLQFRRAHQPESPEGKLSALQRFGANLRIVLGSAALIYGLLLTAHAFSDQFRHPVWFIGLAALTAVLGIVVNLNYVGLHRMYRDRLMETFLPNPESVVDGRWGAATRADGALLEDMCAEEKPRPYHLINTNVILVDSQEAKYRGRGGDNFILSPLYCGCDATGWRSTETYMKYWRSRGMTLATAMAVSGAAVNPHTGVHGKGPTRSRVVSALMSLLNLRLGYWTINPSKKPYPFTPNFFVPGLTRGVFGYGFREASRSIELSDGGHFDNLGLYELIRRRLKVMIVSDGAADPGFDFGDLANAVERVRVDFGTKISFSADIGPDLDGMLPGSAEPYPDEKYRLAKRGFAVAKVEYDEDNSGILVYIKTTLTRDLPRDVYGYKAAYPTFPDQTTADQFFDETQFEAYRELGYQLTKTAFATQQVRNLLEQEGVELS